MLFRRTRDASQRDAETTRLAALTQIIHDFPVHSANIFDSLIPAARLFGATAMSIYSFEAKTHRYVLKKSFGPPLQRISVAADYEFIRHLRALQLPVWRRDLESVVAKDLRQSGLFYFQGMAASVAFCLFDASETGLIANLGMDHETLEKRGFIEAGLNLLAHHLLAAAQHQAMTKDIQKLSEYAQIKNQLLTNVTHELKTPLNGIMGLSAAILDGTDGELSANLRLHIKMIQDAAQQLNGTFNNLLDLASMESAKGKGGFLKLRLRPLVQEVAALFEAAAQQRGNCILLPDHTDDDEVTGNAGQIRTVLMNIIGNAVKFTQNGKIKIALSRSGHFVQVSVSDSGIGIAEDKHEMIFEEFYQADSSATRQHEGTGLGLAVVKKIIALHGGRIQVESRLGEGAIFMFTLPITPL